MMEKIAIGLTHGAHAVGRCCRLAVLACAVGLMGFASAGGAEEIAGSNPSGYAFAKGKRLGRGINILGYDPIWKSSKDAKFRDEYFQIIRDAGFDHVRINLHPFRDAQPNGTLDAHYWKTLDWAIERALVNRLAVVLDFHEFMEMAENPSARKEQWLSVWRQIAERYRGAHGDVLFEPLNEPNGQLTPSMWNRWIRDVLGVIRRTNPKRTVVIGPGHWNSIAFLDELDLPERDRNILVTVHYYEPFAFTHQGAPWMKDYKAKTGIVWMGTEQERWAIRRDFDRAQSWAKKHQRPFYLGEFGVYDKAEMPSKERYLAAVRADAESRGWCWAYWQFDSDFILFDVKTNQWVRPLLDAIIPRSRH